MKKKILANALCATFIGSVFTVPTFADEAALTQKIDKLSAELDALKAELASNRKKTEVVEQKQDVLSNTVQTVAATSAAQEKEHAKTVVSSYGEINYSRLPHSTDQTQADVARAVIGLTHHFDDKTKMVSEFE